jgi:hypothetical protein
MEIKMLTNRLSKIVIVLLVAVIALLTASFTASPKNSEAYQDYAQRHRSEIVAARPAGATDYFQRHPELLTVSNRNVDLSDFFFRQASVSIRGIDLTDYFFRQTAK